MKSPAASRIFYATLAIAVLGLASELFQAMAGPTLSGNNVFVGARLLTAFIDLNFFQEIRFHIDKHYFLPINLVFYSVLLVAAYQFRKSDYKLTRLLSFCLSLLTVSSAACLLLVIYYFATVPEINITLAAIRCLAILLFSTCALRQINASRHLYLSKSAATTEASRTVRFLHLLIDSLLIAIIFTPIMANLQLSSSALFSNYDTYTLLIGQLILAKLFYYVISETVLYTTPAKYLTGCYVSLADGTKPTTGALLKRTFCRFVPFDSLTFLGNRGIHDQISGTTVVKNSSGH